MKFLYLLPIVVAVSGCSSKPSSSDVERRLTETLTSQCEFAKINDFSLDEVIQPDSSNKNRVIAKYSYELAVKIDGPFAAQQEHWKKAKSFQAAFTELSQKPLPAEAKLESLEAMYLLTREPRKLIPGYVEFSADATDEQVDQLRNAARLRIGEEIKLQEKQIKIERYSRLKKYVDSTDGVLTMSQSTDSAGVPFGQLNEPKQPSLPVGCIGLDRRTPFGILMNELVKAGNLANLPDYYIAGTAVKITAEEPMLKTDKGWTFL